MIKYGNTISNVRVIHAGVSQGSVLGLSMYVLYTS